MSFSTIAGEYLSGFAENPVFQDLDVAGLEDLAQIVVLEAGARQEVPTEHVVLVGGGRVAVTNSGRFERLAGPGDLVGLVRMEHSLGVEALQESALLILGPIGLGSTLDDERVRALLHNVTLLAEAEIRHIQSERLELEASLEDYFEPTTAEVIEAPYIARNAKVLTVVCRDPGFIQLPPGLPGLPLSDGRFVLTFCAFPGFGPEGGPGASYEECLVLIPCWDLGGGGPGFYCPEVWPESMMAVIVGSEIFGFPKRYGRVTLAEDHAHVDIGETQAYVHWSGEKELAASDYIGEFAGSLFGEDDPEGRIVEKLVKALCRLALKPVVDSATPLPLYVRRTAGGRDMGAIDWEIDELAWVPFDHLKHHRLVELEGVEMRGWGRFSFAKVERAFLGEIDLSMAAARPVRDLNPNPRARLRTQLMRWGVRKERLWAALRRS